MTEGRPRVVIIGGGFGGLDAARRCAGAGPGDRRRPAEPPPVPAPAVPGRDGRAEPERHRRADPPRAAAPGERRGPAGRGHGRSTSPRKTVLLADGVLAYDYLIVATGATHSYFGHDDWARFAPGLKSVEDALEIRRRVLFAFEAAEREPDPARRAPGSRSSSSAPGRPGSSSPARSPRSPGTRWPATSATSTPRRRRSSSSKGRPASCPSYDDELSAKAREQLVRLGVEVRTGGW